MIELAMTTAFVVVAYTMWQRCRATDMRLAEVELERDELAEALVDKEREVKDLERVLRTMKASGWKVPEREPHRFDAVLDRLEEDLAGSRGRIG